jgi:hypothetical protein
MQTEQLTSLELKDGQVMVVHKDMRCEMSYDTIVRDVFDIQSPFSHATGQKIEKFRQMQGLIRDNKPWDKEQFKLLVNDIASRGVELEGVMRREIQSLERRIGKGLDLWTK